MVKRLIFIRHGMTEGNREKRYIGTTEEALTEEGREALAEAKKRGLYPPADLLFASPLRRCLETASVLYPELSPVTIDEFRECDFGLFEGKNYKELSGNPQYQAWIDSGGTLPFPQGESMSGFSERCVRGLEELFCREDGGKEELTAACIVHGGTIMALLSRFGTEGRGYYDYQYGNGQGCSCTAEKNERGEIRLTCIRQLQFSQALF